MGKLSLFFTACFCLNISLTPSVNENTVVFLMGDSTVATYEQEKPIRGWGQMLPQLMDESLEIRNFAKGGASTKSFIEEGLWDQVLNSLSECDYLFIQFGHNDASESADFLHTLPYSTYQENLTRFATAARARGVIPIFVTPVVRRRFNAEGEFYRSHADYPDGMRALAARLEVPLIDLTQKSKELLIALGEEASKEMFLIYEPGEIAYYPDGNNDNTHFNEFGATEIAKLIVEGIQELGLPLSEAVR